ncbi:MAG: hypothetical protein ACLS90_08675 [Clostridia bacterium]
MKKIVKWIILMIIVLIVIGIGILLVKDLKQEDTLREEILAFDNLTREENIDLEKIDEKIRKIKTTGDYGVVEKAVKEYWSDIINTSIDLTNILNDEKIEKVLTAENYKEDGPDFIETKKYLQEITRKSRKI